MKIPDRMKISEGAWRVIYRVAVVYIIVVFVVVTPLLEMFYDREMVSDAARAIVYLALAAGVLFGSGALIRGFLRLDEHRQLLTFVMGILVVVTIPQFFELTGVIGADDQSGSVPSMNSLTPLANSGVGVTALAVSVWCFSMLWRQGDTRDRKTDAHNKRMEEQMDEVIKLLQAKEARRKSWRRFWRR